MTKKPLRSMADLAAMAAPTIADASVEAPRKPAKPAAPAEGVEQQQVVVQLPAVTVRELKQRALDGNTSLRAVLLQTLKAAGYTVPDGQEQDFRRVRRS